MSVVLRVVLLRRGFILAALKDAGTMPEVREELISEVRNGRMSLETYWRREEGIASRGQVVAWLEVTILLTSLDVRGINWVITEVGMGGGWMAAGIKEELMSFTFCIICSFPNHFPRMFG